MLNTIKSLKYFLLYSLVLIGFYAYSMSIGWTWFTGTSTSHERGEHGTHHSGGVRSYYHK